MKQFVSVILVLLLMLCPAMAEQTEVFNGCELESDVPVQLDLDGDGSLETVEWTQLFPNEYDELVEVRVNGEAVWTSDLLFVPQVYAADLDSDGLMELLVTGDEMSADYITCCLHWSDGKFTPVPFENVSRGEIDTPMAESGYGLVTAIGENLLELTGSQDVLGTYFGTRTFALQDGAFVLNDDGLWHFDRDAADPDSWEYGALTLLESIPVTFVQDGAESKGTLEAGEKFLVTASDRESVAWFVTQDGREGYLPIAPDEEKGWGMTVDGRKEEELFEYVPYAD